MNDTNTTEETTPKTNPIKRLATILRWIIGLFFLTIGASALTHAFLAGVIFSLTALWILPPVDGFLKSKGLKLPPVAKGIICFFLLVLALGKLGNTDAGQSPSSPPAPVVASAPAVTTAASATVNDEPAKPSLNSLPQFTPSALYHEYDVNEIAADEKYKGKEVIVIGNIEDITKELIGDGSIVSLGEALQGVVCGFSVEDAHKISTLRKGQHIAVRGTVEGKMMGVHLKDCVLIKITHREQ